MIYKNGEQNEFCGHIIETADENERERRTCCRSENRMLSFGDCNDISKPNGAATDAIFLFAQYEEAWLAAFREAWQVATSVGQSDLNELVPGGSKIPPFVPEQPNEIEQIRLLTEQKFRNKGQTEDDRRQKW